MACRSWQRLPGDTACRPVSAAPADGESREIGKSWSELPAARQRTFLAAVIERIEVGTNRIDIQFRPTRLGALLRIPATPSSSATDENSNPFRAGSIAQLRTRNQDADRGIGPFATAK